VQGQEPVPNVLRAWEQGPGQVQVQQQVPVPVPVPVQQQAPVPVPVPVPVPGQRAAWARVPVREPVQGPVPGPEPPQDGAPVRVREQAASRWRRRSLVQQWPGSRTHCASTVRWCRSSKPDHRCHFSSCRWFERRRCWPPQPRQTTWPLY